jgi:hypothetical protein
MSSVWLRKVAVAGIVLASLALLPARAGAAVMPRPSSVISMDGLWLATCDAFSWLRTQWSPRPIPDPHRSRAGTPPPKILAGLTNDGRDSVKKAPPGQ